MASGAHLDWELAPKYSTGTMAAIGPIRDHMVRLRSKVTGTLAW